MSIEEMLRLIVREELRAALGTRTPAAATGMLSGGELDKAMSWSARTRKRLEAEGMPGVGTGKLRRYQLDDVRRWLDQRGKPGDVIDIRQRADELLARGRR